MRAGSVLAAIAFGLIGVHSASADGLPRDRAHPLYGEQEPERYNWGGLYVGGHVGGTHAAFDWTANSLEAVNHGSTDFAGGAHAGLQAQWHHAVLGVEVSYTKVEGTDSSLSFRRRGSTDASDVRQLAMAFGRLGYAHDNMLAYVKAGYASADVELATVATGTRSSTSDREHGYAAGLGIDYGLTRNISVGIEYNYVHIGTERSLPSGLQIRDADVDVQSVLARINFRFGGLADR